MWPFKTGGILKEVPSIHMKSSMKGQEKCDILIQVTA